MQTTSLARIGELALNTAMTTSNLRSALAGFVDGGRRHGEERRESWRGAAFSAVLTLAFVGGAALGAVVALRRGGRTFILSAALVAAAVACLSRVRGQAMPSAAR